MPPPYLPAELLDPIVDYLRDTRDALKSCCLVSISWVPRTRMHLFAKVTFKTSEHLQSWKTTFPDPSTSPARHTECLGVYCPEAVTTADAEGRGWIPTFSHVVHLGLDLYMAEISLLPFHGFSPALKFLHIDFSFFPFRRIINIILSFPFLEDLSVRVGWRSGRGGRQTARCCSTSAHRVSEPFRAGRDESYCLSVVSLTE